MHSLSILIPVYNGDCRAQVAELSRQAEAVDGLDYEIVVADDGSPDAALVEANGAVARLPRCRYITRGINVGRSAMRNFLAREARCEWLLFMDCDMAIPSSDFVRRYAECELAPVVYGGYCVGEGERRCLRYVYEKACEPQHRVEERRRRPYQHFHTCNFMARREVMLQHPFDERFQHYGYEDVLFGKQLRAAGVGVDHIDNPAGFFVYEANDHFVTKTEEGLRTLHTFRADLRGYSRLLTFAEGIHLGVVRGALRLWHRLFGRLERRNLCGRRPSLRIFKLYKLGYYLCLG